MIDHDGDRRSFFRTTLGRVAREVAERTERRVVVQRNLTDWDFLVQLARRNDFRVWVDEREGVLHFRKPQGGDPGPVTFGVLQEE